MKTLLLALATLTLASTTSLAQPPNAGAGFQDGFGIAAMFANLDLTDEQKRSIAITLRDNRDRIKEALANVAESRENLMSHVHNNIYDEAAVRDAYAEVADAGEVAVLLRARLTADIRAQLSDEQLQIVDGFREDRKSRVRGVLSRIRQRVQSWIDDKVAG